MSENKKPENLLAEIAYSRKRVLVKEYRDGVFKWLDEYSTWRGKPGNRPSLVSDEIEAYVTPKIATLLGTVFCGITVEVARTSDDDTVIRIYKLADHIRCHRLYCDRHLHIVDAWLRKFLNSTGALHVYSAEAARGEVPAEWDVRAETEDLVAYAKAAVKTELTDGDATTPTDHIPALRGLFALARGNYATVSPEDLTAAVDAGYVHPDFLSAVADEIALAAEASA